MAKTPIEKSPERLKILAKIAEYEKNGWFDKDVEDDPITEPLKPGEVDYATKKLSSKIKVWFANIVARAYFDNTIRKGELIIKNVYGMENFLSVKGGAFLTCNHFNPNDNYAVYKVIRKSIYPRELYKIIREGNYTSFKGLFGFFFRNCNTLPLGSSFATMRELFSGLDELTKRGEKILIYPEQSMWWNYRKPRPMKDGAFNFASRFNVPIIPFFITMEDSEKIGADGFFIQEYSLHISKPIYPDKTLKAKECAEKMRAQNYADWKEIYERVYQTPLTYTSIDPSCLEQTGDGISENKK